MRTPIRLKVIFDSLYKKGVVIVHIGDKKSRTRKVFGLSISVIELERELRKRVQSFIAVTKKVRSKPPRGSQELQSKLVVRDSESKPSVVADSFLELVRKCLKQY